MYFQKISSEKQSSGQKKHYEVVPHMALRHSNEINHESITTKIIIIQTIDRVCIR